MTAEKALEYIFCFDRNGSPLKDLSRARQLMELIGNPERKLTFIHVAGTNGKGSVCEYLSEILQAAGVKTGLFTSPFIVRYNDRIRINGEDIADERLAQIVTRLQPLIDKSPLRQEYSQFEITQAIAFTYFLEEGVQAVVLETGVGGRLDCTNVISAPLVSVITNIALDHTEVLGDTLQKIAAQKAGIIKEGCPVVVGMNLPPQALEVIRGIAAEKNAPLVIPDAGKLQIISSSLKGSVFCCDGENYEISMTGRHQVLNAVCAVECAKLIKERFSVGINHIRCGLKKAALMARVQIISTSPLVILDGGHNPDGTSALADALKNAPRPIAAVIGMNKGKNAALAVTGLRDAVDFFVTTDGFSERCVDRDELRKIIEKCEIDVCTGSGDLLKDIKKARKFAENGGTTVICGSLYLAAEVIAAVKRGDLKFTEN